MDLKNVFLLRGMRIRILGPVIFFFLLGTTAMLFLHERAVSDISYKTGLNQASTLLDSVSVAIDFPMTIGDEESVKRILSGLKKRAKVYILAPDGTAVYAPESTEQGVDILNKLPEELVFRSKEAIKTKNDKPIVEVVSNGNSGELLGIKLIKNQPKCFHCHGSSREVLGMMVMRSDISNIILAEKKSLRTILLIIAVSVVVAVSFISFLLNKIAIEPIKNLANRLKELATGEADLTKELDVQEINCSEAMKCDAQECPSYGKKTQCWSESGSYASEVHCPKITSGELSSCEECKAVYQRAIVTEIDEAAAFVNSFINRIRGLVARTKKTADSVGEESKKMKEESVKMSENAEETSQNVKTLLQAAEVTTDMVNNVVAAMEEMNATVIEISQNTSKSREVAFGASEKAQEAAQVIKQLSEASDKIGEISKLIGSIAEQTNLLALNATIEAARAGEAGKGFAVVANEVKELAKQTGESVVGIDETVQELKTDVEKAVSAIDGIVAVIDQINEMAESIASAVEEQSATTSEISMNASNTGETVQEMTQKIKDIADSSERAQEGSKRVKNTSEELQKLFEKLHSMLEEFKV